MDAIKGPMYGTIFKTAHKKAIINKLGIPKIDKTTLLSESLK